MGQLASQDSASADVDDSKFLFVLIDERIAKKVEIGHRNIEHALHPVVGNLVESRWRRSIISPRRNPHIAVLVSTKSEQIRCHINLAVHFERSQVDDTHPAVVGHSLPTTQISSG